MVLFAIEGGRVDDSLAVLCDRVAEYGVGVAFVLEADRLSGIAEEQALPQLDDILDAIEMAMG